MIFDDGDKDWYSIEEVETLEENEPSGEFGLEALGLGAKIQEKLEGEGYSTVAELKEALEDGTLDDLKDIPAAALKRIKEAVESFEG